MNFEMQPTLESDRVLLRPLMQNDFEALYAVASDPEIWAQHPAHDRWKRTVFDAFFRDAMASKSAFAVVDRSSGDLIGSSRYNGFDAVEREVEIGWTFLARSHWGGETNRAIKQLMLDHAFRFVDTVIFWVGEDNIRSRRAVEKLGARLRSSTEERAGAPHVVYALSKAVWEL